MKILICYDGSPDGRAAIEHGAELLQGHEAVVLTVWEPFVETVARTTFGFGLMAAISDADAIDEVSAQKAQERAEEGTTQARHAGLDAEPRTCAQETTTARAILSEAGAVGAGAIVMGSRGRTGLKSLLLGSVSHEVIQHADRPVIIVPSPKVAAARGASVRDGAERRTAPARA